MAARRRKPNRGARAPGWLWMLFGLALGLIAAGGVYLSGAGREPASASAPAAPQPSPAAPRAAPSATARDSRAGATRASAGAAGAGAAKDSKKRGAEEPKFDFYDILPQYEVVVPEVESVAPATRAPAAPVETPGNYVLQAGSFRSHEEADRMQASLALLGIESRIQKVTVDDDEFHRVRIGPIDDLKTLNRIRDQLRDAGINALVMRVSGQ
ncbi:MAG TPA: SPOR domain-containing protein [Gammaproteobacteria bacterium]|nr:SPOR domain-containing protein [Gammaproteobacteria bacterium]